MARGVLEEVSSQSANLPVDDPTRVVVLIMVTEWTPPACNVMQSRVRIDEIYCVHSSPSQFVDGSSVLLLGSVLTLIIATLAFQPHGRSPAQRT